MRLLPVSLIESCRLFFVDQCQTHEDTHSGSAWPSPSLISLIAETMLDGVHVTQNLEASRGMEFGLRECCCRGHEVKDLVFGLFLLLLLMWTLLRSRECVVVGTSVAMVRACDSR